jgi:hypothetical protein
MSEKKQESKRNTRLLLAVILILPFFLLIGREIAWGQTIGYFRVVDLADLFILAPLYTAILLYLWFRMQSYDAPRWLLLFFIIFVIIFMYGHAVHFTGNSLNTYISEVNDYKDQMPADVYDMIFYLDEEFSHILLFIGSTGLIAGWLMFDQLVKEPPVLPENVIFIAILAILYGIVQAYAIIEAQTVALAPLIILTLGGIWVWLWRKSGLGIWPFFRSRPFTMLVAIMLFGFISAIVVWGLIFQGFPQPSEMGL